MRKHKADVWIGVITMLLMAVGLIVIYAIGPQRANFLNSAYDANYSENYFFIHQAIAVGLSIAAFIVAFLFPYQKMQKFTKAFLITGFLLCALLAFLALTHSSLAPGEELGAHRWIQIGQFSIQPAEILKLGLILYLPQLAKKHKEEGTLGTREFFTPFIIVTGLSLFFVVILQKDLGTGAVIIAMSLAILWVSGIEIWKFLATCGVILALAVGSIIVSPHRMSRVMTFVGDGDSDDSYHIDNSMLAIGTGGMFGVGIGNSVQATGYLPESINDSVFAVMGETFGFIGLMLVIFCFAFLLMRLLKMVPFLDEEQGMVVTGVFAWIIMHVVVNISAMTGLIPLTGITLPLLSYGGTSMLFMALALGLCLQLSRYTGRREVVDSLAQRGTRRVNPIRITRREEY